MYKCNYWLFILGNVDQSTVMPSEALASNGSCYSESKLLYTIHINMKFYSRVCTYVHSCN